MTVLQKIIKEIDEQISNLNSKGLPSRVKGLVAAKEIINNHLPVEEQQIRDAWAAAILHKKAMDYDGNDEMQKPDLDKYIKTLTSK